MVYYHSVRYNVSQLQTTPFFYRYVYKRLKFLGNRYISQAAALVFLAVWHGLHSGYYMCFLLEFVIMKLEKDVSIDVLDFKFLLMNLE